MVAELAEVDTSAKLRQHLEERLATIACHSVIRANRQLEPHEMRALLEASDQVDFATQCPHGRPGIDRMEPGGARAHVQANRLNADSAAS